MNSTKGKHRQGQSGRGVQKQGEGINKGKGFLGWGGKHWTRMTEKLRPWRIFGEERLTNVED